MTAALIGSAVALTAYTLGIWIGRRTAECDHAGQHRLDSDLTSRADRYRLAWLSARRRARHDHCMRIVDEDPNERRYWGDGEVWMDRPDEEETRDA
jgi:hypothetical protein